MAIVERPLCFTAVLFLRTCHFFAYPSPNFFKGSAKFEDDIEDDIASHGMGLPEARVAAQNRPYWRMLAKHGATRS